jgi:hypothetical protein
VNLDALNRYVLVVIGLFAASLYIATVFTGFSEMISRVPKARRQRKRSGADGRTRRFRNAKKST